MELVEHSHPAQISTALSQRHGILIVMLELRFRDPNVHWCKKIAPCSVDFRGRWSGVRIASEVVEDGPCIFGVQVVDRSYITEVRNGSSN